MAKRCESVALCVALLAVAAHGRAYGRAAVAAPISMALTMYTTSTAVTAVSTQSKAVVIASTVGYFAESLEADEDAAPPPDTTCPDFSNWSNFTCKAVFTPEENMACLVKCLWNHETRVKGLLLAKAEAAALKAKGNQTRLVMATDLCELEICGDKEGGDRETCLVGCFRDTANVDIAPGEPSLEQGGLVPSEPASPPEAEDIIEVPFVGELPRVTYGFTCFCCGICLWCLAVGIPLLKPIAVFLMIRGLVLVLPTNIIAIYVKE